MRRLAVHQMGKVASSAITDLVVRALGEQVPQIHALDRRSLRNLIDESAKKGQRPAPHIKRSELVLEWLDQGDDIDFITLIREPFARNLSAFFTNINWFMDNPAEADSDEITDTFMDHYPHHVPLTWFDKQVRGPIGIDVYQQPFDVTEGHSIIDLGRFRMLVLRYESSATRKRQLIGDFLGIQMPALERMNTTSDKKIGQHYEEVKRNLRLDPDFVELMLASQYCTHFYSAAERDRMWARWVEGNPAGL